jgi:GrpB-like predicted nucleotidyltransferase (UPF0157 family)
MEDLENIGVQKGKVKLCNFQADWNERFEVEQHYLASLLSTPKTNIYHFGSTSVLNCKAKPIIDIAIPYKRLSDSFKHQKILCETEYSLNNIYYLTDRICFTKGTPQTHHLYLIEEESITFHNWIIFKAIISSNFEILTAYCNLKTKLAELYPDDRIKYTEEKSKFIFSTLNSNKLWQEKISSMKS